MGKEYHIRLDSGEQVRYELTRFLEDKQIQSGILFGIGAFSQVKLAYYHPKTGRYHEKTFEGVFEVLGLQGNISLLDDKPFLHLHASLSDKKYRCFGGHLMEATVGPTLELYLKAFDEALRRKSDLATGLKLMDL